MKIAVHKVHYVLMLAVLHHNDLIDDKILFRLLLQIHLLYGDASFTTHLDSSEDAS